MGRYMQGGHLMIDASQFEWIRIFPLTVHYMIRAKNINKVQRLECLERSTRRTIQVGMSSVIIQD